ncbi:MAG: BrnA antitoxin family protein [Steroidobacteraceae bacterium]
MCSAKTWRDRDDAPEITEKLVRRDRPAGTAKKTQTTVSISNEVLRFFRATGRGWQTRMDEALKQYVAAQRR